MVVTSILKPFGKSKIVTCHFGDCGCKMTTNIDVQIKEITEKTTMNKIEIIKKKEYFDISYTYEPFHKTKCVACDMCHPFHSFSEDEKEDHENGDIIVKNKLTECMIENLLKKNKELEKTSGNTCGIDYKIRIMWGLSYLWD